MVNQGCDDPGGGSLLRNLIQRICQRARPTFETAADQPNRLCGTVLIVELEGWKSGSLPRLLGKLGYQAKIVQGEKAALEALKQESPLLFIVGGMAAPSLYSTLRQASAVPILALAPEPDDEQLLSAYAAGVDQYQIGPVSDNEIAARARALVRRAKWPAVTPEG